MVINAVNLYKNIGVSNATGYADSAIIPKGDTKPNEVSVRANGGVSEDGDTVTVSAEGSSLQKMSSINSTQTRDRLEDGSGNDNSAASVVSYNARYMGITKENNELRNSQASADLIGAAVDKSKEASRVYAEANEDIRARNDEKKAEEKTDDKAADRKAEENADKRVKEANEKNVINENDDTAARRPDDKDKTDKAEKEDITADLIDKKNKEPVRDRTEEALKELQSRRKEENDREDKALTERAEERREERREERKFDLEKSGENLQNIIGNREEKDSDEDMYNVEFSFKEDPYDVTASIKEMEEDETAVGGNRTERQERRREEINERESERAERPEENPEEIENVAANLNTEAAAEANNAENIAAAADQAAAGAVAENAANNRVIVQEVA